MDSTDFLKLGRKLNIANLACVIALQFVAVAGLRALTFEPVFTFDSSTSASVQQQQEQATRQALDNFAKYFQPSNITLRVEFTFHDLGADGTLGQGGPEGFEPLQNVYYAQALFNFVAKHDLSGGAVSLSVEMNTNPSTAWFYGASTPPQNQYSWQDVIMHEVGHAMGFFDTVNTDGSYTNAGPSIFETLATLGVNGSPLSSLDQPARAQAVISNNVYWNGQFAIAANGGNPIKLYAPNPYEEGSNYSHIDPSQSGIAGLYYPSLADATFFPGPTEQELAIFHDIGWATSPFDVQLVNISTRVVVGMNEQIGIGGFIVRGTKPKKVLIRGIGPSLKARGVANPLSHPYLQLHDSTGAVIASNVNWRSAPEAAEIEKTGAAPSDEAEAAIISTVQPGKSYTAWLAGTSDSTSGVGLIEIYDLEVNSGPDLANISTRGNVLTGENIMIGGFIVEGVNAQTVVARGIGPSLTAAGVQGALADPTIEIRDAHGTVLISNNDWRDDANQANALQQAKIAPTRDEEAAVIANVAAGNYTALLRGNNNTTGVGLVEIYNLGTSSGASSSELSDSAAENKPKPLNPGGRKW